MGAISNSREDNKTMFKVLWMIIFFVGLILTINGLCKLCNRIQKYEVNTSVNVEKRSFLKFPAITICNKNLIHCQHLFDMIVECENISCQRWELYCNIYVTGNCTQVVPDDGNPVCNGHKPEITLIDKSPYDSKLDVARQFSVWYTHLNTDEMKKLAHQPQELIVECKFSMINTTLCNHFTTSGGTRIFSPTRGVCYSLNLREYFPLDLKESLKSDVNKYLFETLETDMFYAGPLMGLQLVLNIQGKYKTGFHIVCCKL